MKKINITGFTLVELIAVIVIMGLISLMAFPSIMNAISSNNTTSCKHYESAIVLASKSYIQKEGPDLLENEEDYYDLVESSGYKLTVNELIHLGYLEEYNDPKFKIDTTNSGAYVIIKMQKDTNTYTYHVKFNCLDNRGKTIYSK